MKGVLLIIQVSLGILNWMSGGKLLLYKKSKYGNTLFPLHILSCILIAVLLTNSYIADQDYFSRLFYEKPLYRPAIMFLLFLFSVISTSSLMNFVAVFLGSLFNSKRNEF